jgi:hypothetical protein
MRAGRQSGGHLDFHPSVVIEQAILVIKRKAEAEYTVDAL